MVVRYMNIANTMADWHLAVVDSLSNKSNVRKVIRIITDNTTILYEIGSINVSLSYTNAV